MYNERKDSFSIKDIIVQLLFIVLFVFILIWLFPTKSSLNGKLDAIDEVNTKFDVLTNRIFNDNLQTMKEAAISYYTTPRLPKNVNDVKSMTLREMLKEKLLIEFKDANNKSCDLDDSYVEITKLEDEFLLKVNLSCTDNDAYILVHLGCYDYCSTDVCENKNVAAATPVVNKKTTSNQSSTTNQTSTQKPVAGKTCTYKYQKVVTQYVWTGWSAWSTNPVSETSNRKVETKTETVKQTKDVLVSYKKTTYKDMNSPITKNVQVQTSTVNTSYCTSYTSQYTSTGQKKYEWIDQGTAYYNTHPKPNSTTRYEYVGSTPADCSDCYNNQLYIYRKYTLKIYDVVSKDSICSSWANISTPLYVTVPKIIGYNTYTKVTPVYEKQTVTTPVKYYRYKTLYANNQTLTEWSSSANDQSLIKQGYKYVTSVCK